MYSREDVLARLKDWSEENGGKTPSEKVFYKFLGNFGVFDLHKLGWPYYGKLVEEAGLKPNIFDKTKYTRDELCELFISVIREYDNWPSRGELEVLHHNKKDKYPDASTFYNKLGLVKNGDLAKSILDYIKDRDGYDDITVICKPVYDRYKNNEKTEETIQTGFVYLCKSGNQYRIGMTNNPERRQGEVGVLLVDPYELIHIIETDDMRGVEDYWHTRFKQKLIRGEWFRLNSSDIKAFKRWKKIF
jgi:hypothetical protein